MEGGGPELKLAPSSLSRNPQPVLSPIVLPGGSSPQNRDGPLASKKRSASQLFNFINDDLEVVEVLSNPIFAPVTDDSPRTFSSFRDGIGALSSQSSPRILSSPSLTSGSCFNSSPDDTPSVCSNGGSAAISPAVFNRLSIASPHLGAPSPALVSPAPRTTWISSGALATPCDSCIDSVETSVGHDLLSPFVHLPGVKPCSSSAMPRSSSEESFDGNISGRTQFSQAVTASNPGTPVVSDCGNSCFALARSSSFEELSCFTEEKSAPSPVLHFPARSMSASTISSAELHESSGAGGLSFLFFKRSRDGLNAVTAQTLASMLRGGSNVDPPLLCPVSAEPTLLRAGAACPLSQQLSAQAARFTVIDARYDFEFTGGCVEGAISINKESDLCEFFFPEQRRAEREGHPVPLPPPPSEHVYVFHCEYSQKRGPSLLNALRELDRKFNQYPKLSYPHLYILDQGYKHFFETHSYCCDGGYIPMKDPQFKTDLAIAKKACCQKRAKVSSVRAARLPAAEGAEPQESAAARLHAFTGCSGSFPSLPCDTL